MTKQSAKQINPLKVLIDHDTDVRATNFHGTSKNGRSYVQPQICFVRATGMDNKTGKGKNIDISFPFHNIQTIIDSLTAIRDKNEEYFDDNEDTKLKNILKYIYIKYTKSKYTGYKQPKILSMSVSILTVVVLVKKKSQIFCQ